MADTYPHGRDHYRSNSRSDDIGINGPKSDGSNGAELTRVGTNVTLTQEQFERLFLSPTRSAGGSQLRATFGNPTPLGLVGFLLSLTPLSCVLMGWRGATSAVVQTGAYYALGGTCMIFAGIGEWILGNTFPFVVFFSFGSFWVSFAILNSSFYGLQAAYSTTGSAAQGAESIGYNSGFSFYLLFWGLMCTVYFVISLRTNVVFATIFLTVDMAFLLLAGTYWHTAAGNMDAAHKCTVAAGAFGFVCTMAGWYLLIVILLDSLDFPIVLPVGDLSNFIKPRKRIPLDEKVV
ncbi:hypothetical protein PYCC9005_001148 [Savitreella phatthalungensis]